MKKEIYEGECESIFEQPKETKPKRKLVFSHWINKYQVKMTRASSQPHEYDQVRHLVANIYIAWFDSEPENKMIYIGHYE